MGRSLSRCTVFFLGIALLVFVAFPVAADDVTLPDDLRQFIVDNVTDEQKDVLEEASEALEAGVSEQFIEGAVQSALDAGLTGEDIKVMLEDLGETYEEGTGEDLDQIVEDHLQGDNGDDDDGDLDDDDDVDTDEEGDSHNGDEGEEGGDEGEEDGDEGDEDDDEGDD
jgi:hypothetical protein